MIKLNLTAVLVVLVLLVLLYFVIDQKFMQSEPKQNYDSIVGVKEHRIQALRWDSAQLAIKLRSLEIKSAYDANVLHTKIKTLQHNATQHKQQIDTTTYATFNKWLRKRYPRTDKQKADTAVRGFGQLKLASPFTLAH